MNLIGLIGASGSGKDTVASFMPARRFSFAKPLKDICKSVFDFSDLQLFGPSEERNRPDTRYMRAPCPMCTGPMDRHLELACVGPGPLFLTPRHALQTLGTEWGRACYTDVWAELGVRQAVEWLADAPAGSTAVLTDCRFASEAKAIRAVGGQIWRVERPGHVLPPEIAGHLSEQEHLAIVPDLVIVNAGTLEDLQAKVRAAFL